MSKISPFILLLVVFLNACKSPEADFYMDKQEAEVGEEVIFKNLSELSHSYEWDMGDGTSSEEEDVFKRYNAAGTYTITLTAYNKNKKRSATAQKTLLVRNVNEKFVGNYFFSNSACDDDYSEQIEARVNDQIILKNFVNKGFDLVGVVNKSSFKAENFQSVVNGVTYYTTAFGTLTDGLLAITYQIGTQPNTGEECSIIAERL